MRPAPIGFWLVLAGLAAAAVWFAALHPLSGVLGGIYFLVLGGVMPTVAVALVSIGLGWLVPAPLPVRIVFAAILSILLGLNTSLARLPSAAAYRPQISQNVQRTAALADSKYHSLTLRRADWLTIFTRPLRPHLRIGSDEGCGCMYFLPATDDIYADRLLATMRAATGSGSVSTYETRPQAINEDLHVDLHIIPNGAGADVTIAVLDKGETIATFNQRALPRSVAMPEGVGREKLADDFWANAARIFLHDNVWTAVVERFVPDTFPESQLRAFFDAAVRR